MNPLMDFTEISCKQGIVKFLYNAMGSIEMDSVIRKGQFYKGIKGK